MKAYKFHASSSCYPCNNYDNKNHKSIVIPAKFRFPQSSSLSFGNSKHISRLCEFRCSSSSPSFSRLSADELETLDSILAKIVGVDSSAVLQKFVFSHKILSLSVKVLDEDGKIGQKIDDLVGKGIYEYDKKKKVDIVLQEVVPLLLEHPDRWVSSSFTVSSSGPESLYKLKYDPSETTETENASSTVRCTKVFVDEESRTDAPKRGRE